MDQPLSFQTALDEVVPRFVAVLTQNVVGLCLAAVAWFGLVIAGVLAVLIVPFFVAGPGFGILIMVYGEAEPPSWALLAVILPSMLAYLVCFGGLLFGLTPAMQGSLYRAFDGALAGGALSAGAPLSSLRLHLRPVVLTNATLVCGALLGFLLLVIPGLLFSLLTLFALPAAALDGLGPTAALSRAVGHARANPGYHAGIILGAFLISMLGSAIPVLGSGLATVVSMGWICACYRRAFPADAGATEAAGLA